MNEQQATEVVRALWCVVIDLAAIVIILAAKLK
jgi:choline-glycine betaine transporter